MCAYVRPLVQILYAFTVKVGNTILDLEVLCKIAAMNHHLFCFRHFDCIETFSSFTLKQDAQLV